VNLGWKLAQVVSGSSPDGLLDTYHAERHPVGARVLHNTMAQVALRGTDERTAALRDTITGALLLAGFQFDPDNAAHRDSGNASRYTIYQLPYAPIVAGEGTLRPEIQIETAVWPLRLPSVDRSVTSFWAEAFKQPPEVASIPCVALVETIAEKFVALTRRAGAELADAGGPRDKTLVRHVYDLHVVRSHYDPAVVIALAREIIRADVEAYGHQFPAYRENPIAETLRAVGGLATDDRFASYYAEFLRDMVYGEAPDFRTALATISVLADGLRE